MEFERFFSAREHPKLNEKIGVMSLDSLARQWESVAEENGFLLARSKDGRTALLGGMGKREDGKFCVEIAIRATIKNNCLSAPEFWYVDPACEQSLYGMMQRLVCMDQRDGDR